MLSKFESCLPGQNLFQVLATVPHFLPSLAPCALVWYQSAYIYFLFCCLQDWFPGSWSLTCRSWELTRTSTLWCSLTWSTMPAKWHGHGQPTTGKPWRKPSNVRLRVRVRVAIPANNDLSAPPWYKLWSWEGNMLVYMNCEKKCVYIYTCCKLKASNLS